jgi:peptidoglycan hydrolase-like protein with peptidoglycan-binding domain
MLSCLRLARAIGLGAIVAVAATAVQAAPAFASSQHLGDRVLKQGMSGHDVVVLQDYLTRAGFPTKTVGVFGASTEQNVQRFERKYHLKVDGVADASFVRKLRLVVAARSSTVKATQSAATRTAGASGGASLASTPKSVKPAASRVVKSKAVASTGGSQHLGDRVLKQGMSGHDVRVLQGYLTIAGFPTTVDGQFGPTTKRNVIAFQQGHNFTPNGIVTHAVEQQLRAVVAAQQLTAPVGKARINPNGTATAPADAPSVVKAVIASANRIIGKPYIYAGGHGTWEDSGYDCSGAVSYALHGAHLLASPEDSTELESYGSPGRGRWITIYADSSHTWVVVAGRAFDTADFGGPNIPIGSGPRWRSNPTGNLGDGGNYIMRHPSGL